MSDIDNELKIIYKNMLNLNNNIDNINKDIILLGDTYFYKNLNVSGNTIINDITLNSSLNTFNNIITNNININTDININNYINNNYITVNNNLYSSSISNIFNNLTINSNLNILGYGLFNTVQTTLLNVSTNTILLNITSNSNFNVINNMTILSNININNNLSVLNNTNINNSTILSNLYVSNASYINLPITVMSNVYNFGKLITTNMTASSNLNILGDINIFNTGTFNNITILSNITVNNVLICNNVYTNSIIIDNLLEYDTNTNAISNYVSTWDYYRTGDILKITIDNIPPYINNKTVDNIIIKGNKYTEIGINLYDNISNITDISVFITSIATSGVNYLVNPIQITTTTIINELNTLILGNHIITYTAYDKENNYSTLLKTVTVVLDGPPVLTLIGASKLKIALGSPYIEQGATVVTGVTLVITGSVDTTNIGKYLLTYTATNISYMSTVLIRTVYILNVSTISPFNFIDLTANIITSNDLVFYLKVSDMDILKASWFTTNKQYEFIPHEVSNAVHTVTKIQNDNGWSRSGLIGWVMRSNPSFALQDWTKGFTLDQWIYIDYNYISSTTKMLLVGQGYGLCLSQTDYPYTTYPYNVLSFITNNLIKNEGNGLGTINLNDLKGKWSHIAVSISTSTMTTSKTLNLYLNGVLRISLSETQWLNEWPNIATNTIRFSIACNNAGIIQTESLNTIFFGDISLYNRILYDEEILNNYNYNKNKYLTSLPITKPSYITRIPTYNLSAGYLSYQIDLNNFKNLTSWTVESWIYSSGWLTSNINILNINNNYLSFGINSTGNPYFLYNTILKTSSTVISLSKWVHIVYQKNNNTEVQIFVNGISIVKFPILTLSLNFPSFGQLNLNNLIIGNTTTFWNGLVSQLKISYTNLYTDNFTPVIDTILDTNTFFLLDDNYINIANNKYLQNFNAVIDNIITPKQPIISLIGDSYITLYKDINTYTELGAITISDLRINIPPIVIQNNVNTSIINLYTNIYTIIGLNYVGYNTRTINVIKYNIPPTIILNGSSIIYLNQGNIYIEQGVTITNNLLHTILPIISGYLDINIIGTYTLTYIATDIYDNSSYINRTIIITTLPINNIYFWIDASISANINLNTSNIITNVKDITTNNIIIQPLLGSPLMINNRINELPMFDLSNSSMKSLNTFENSNNITFAIIVEHQDITSNSCIWGHFNNFTTDLLLNNNLNKTTLTSNNDTSINLQYSKNIPVMYIGVLSNGTVLYLKMIDLTTGIEITGNATIVSSIIISNCSIYLGSNTTQLSHIYIGELLYWKKILTSLEIFKIETYLYRKWGNRLVSFQYSTILPILTLNGFTTYYSKQGFPYFELSAKLLDILEPTLSIIITGDVNVNILGNYIITYTVTDSMNNSISVNRTIIILDTINPFLYDTTNGSIQLPNTNFNILNNNNWTCEIWVFMKINSNAIIFDFRDLNNTYTSNFWLEIRNMKPIIQSPSNLTVIGSTTTRITLNKWSHVAWVRKDSYLYIYINGILCYSNSIPTYLNTLSNLNYICIGSSSAIVNKSTSNFKGILSQPLILSSAKYSSAFFPQWKLEPSTIDNIVLWFNYGIEIISQQKNILYGTVIETEISTNPTLPILTLNSISPFDVLLTSIYADYGIIATSYLYNTPLLPYIISIKSNLIELLSVSLLANTYNVLDLNTSTLTEYLIKYSASENIYTNTITRNVVVLNTPSSIQYNTTNSYINTIVCSYLINTTCTFEAWIFLTSYQTSYTYIYDMNEFSLLIDSTGYMYIYNNTSYIKVSTTMLSIDKWYHIAWSFTSNLLSCYINGILSGSISYILASAYINNITIASNKLYNNTTFIKGLICQPLISKIVKYTSTFIPSWYLNYNNNITNVLFWLFNNIEFISHSLLVLNNVIYTKLTTIPVNPEITLINSDEITIKYSTNYIEYGTRASYILQAAIPVVYITSIKTSSNIEYITSPITVSDNLVLNQTLLNSTINTIYTITYTCTATNGNISTSQRLVYIATDLISTLVTPIGLDTIKDVRAYYYGDIICSNNIYLFIPTNADGSPPASSGIYGRSTNLTNWTLQYYLVNNVFTPVYTAGGTAQYIRWMGTSKGFLIIIRRNIESSESMYYHTSIDGITWSTSINPIPDQVYNISYGGPTNGYYFAITAPQKNYISLDGLTWNTYYRGSQYFSNLIYGNGIYMAISQNRYIITSSDCINWSTPTSLTYLIPTALQATTQFGKALFNNNTFIITSYDTNNVSINKVYIVYSNNTITWKYKELPTYPTSIGIYVAGLAYINTQYVITYRCNNDSVARDTYFYYIVSSNLKAWSLASNPIYSNVGMPLLINNKCILVLFGDISYYILT